MVGRADGLNDIFDNDITVKGIIYGKTITPQGELDLVNKKYVDDELGDYVPYIGATANVDLGSKYVIFDNNGLIGNQIGSYLTLRGGGGVVLSDYEVGGGDLLWKKGILSRENEFMDAPNLGTTTLTWGTAYISTLDFGTNTITDGNMTGDWDLGSGDLTTTGDINTDTLQINESTGNWKFGKSTVGGFLAIYPTETANTRVAIYPKTSGDSTFLHLYNECDALGVVTESNRSRISIISASGDARFQTDAGGTGTPQTITISAGASSNALFKTDGSTNFNGQVDVSADFNVIDSVSSFGDIEDSYLEIDNLGKLRLYEDARVKRMKTIDLSAMKRGVGSPPAENLEDGFPTLDFDDSSTEEVFVKSHAVTDVDNSENVYVHLDFFVDSSPATDKVVRWGVEYKVVEHGEVFDFSSGTTIKIFDTTILATTDNKELISTEDGLYVNAADVPANGGMLIFRLYREGGHANDTYTGDARLVNVNMVYTANKLGKEI